MGDENQFSLASMYGNQQPDYTAMLDTGNLLGKLKDSSLNVNTGVDSLIKGNSLAAQGSNGFFTEGNSTMQNIGEGIGLAGATMSLADMINNWGMNKKALNLNMANTRQAMGQSKEAFDRSKARQDRTSAALLAANNAANSLANQNG